MGGYGSGFKGAAKATTDGSLRLDVGAMAKAGSLRPGAVSAWQWTRGGQPCGNIQVQYEKDRLVLVYRSLAPSGQWQDRRLAVPLVHTACGFGGERPWFLCPNCGLRVAILYLGGSGAFSCRHCLDLAYPSSREETLDRAFRRVDKLRARLRWTPGIAHGAGPKPRGMHWRTYERLVLEHERLAAVTMTESLRQLERAGAKLKGRAPG